MPDATNAIRCLKIASLVALLESGWGLVFPNRVALSCWATAGEPQRRHGAPAEATVQTIGSWQEPDQAPPSFQHLGSPTCCCLFSPSAPWSHLFLDCWWFSVKLKVTKSLNRLSPTCVDRNAFQINGYFTGSQTTIRLRIYFTLLPKEEEDVFVYEGRGWIAFFWW